MTMRKRGHAPAWRWLEPERHPTIGSTNAEALAGPVPGRVVVADHQSAGRGRQGRTWSSPPGVGMAISAVVPVLPTEVLGWVPLAAGLAVQRALARSRWPVRAELKWPNDVLVPEGARPGARPGKICGILAQVADPRDAGAIVVGTGINVDHEVDQLPVPTATSWRLARGGAPLPDQAREVFLQDYLHELAQLHDDLAQGRVGAVRAAYREACATLGAQVAVHLPGGGRATGAAVDVDEQGALVVAGATGRAAHAAGDVEHLRRAVPPTASE